MGTSSILSAIVFTGLIACSLFIAPAQAKSGLNYALSHLNHYLNQGGFRSSDSEQQTISATASALFLANLFGLQNKINSTETLKFISSLENGDYGYGRGSGLASDLESVRDALLSSQYLGTKPTNANNIVTYITSLFDKDSNLFSNSVGEKGSIKATALAFQSLDLLGELKRVPDAVTKVKDILKKYSQTGDVNYFKFPEVKGLSQTSANYYGILLGSLAGFDFASPAKWAKHIASLQSSDGLFYTDASKKTTSLEATAHAMASLRLLAKAAKDNTILDSIDVNALRNALQSIPTDLTSAAHAHLALASTNGFRDNFDVMLNYEGLYAGPIDNHFVEGTQIKPTLSVVSRLDATPGIPHAGFDVSVQTRFQGKEPVQSKMTWNPESQRYVGENLPTTGRLGPVEFVYTLRLNVPGFGDLSHEINDLKSVGYGVVVNSKATLELSGREIREGEAVSTGTDFKFAVTLNNLANENILTGDFVITFTVLDSSLVTLHQSKVDGSTNKAPLSFGYTLKSADIPAGKLSFRFDVAGKGSKTPHTTRTVSYPLVVPMVATNIVFDGVAKGKAPSFKIGDKVRVSFEPATFPDLRTVNPIPAKDMSGADVSAIRLFFMDVRSPQGALLRCVPCTGVKAGTSAKHSCDVTVDASLDSVGTNVLSFRYKPSVGDEIILQNYDSAVQELYEDTQVLNYTVNADLNIVDIMELPKAGDLFYGTDVVFKFRVKDTTSGQYVGLGSSELANIYMDLQHEEEGGRPFTSVHLPATVGEDSKGKFFTITWTINPNAIRGAGTLTLSAEDADGKKLPLYKDSKTKDQVQMKVNIGGAIEVDPRTYSATGADSRLAAFVVELGLFCRNVSLRNAELRSTLLYNDGQGHEEAIATLPVAHHGSSYTVSWTAPHTQVRTGTYRLLFYREVDRARALERRDIREKRLRKERQIKGEQEDVLGTPLDETDLQPLFVVEIPHSPSRLPSLPFRSEFLAALVLGSVVGWLSYKKSSLK